MEKDSETTPQPDQVNNDAETIEHLNRVIDSLKQKLTVSEGKVAELEETQRQLAESEKSRIDLSLCLKESGNKILIDSNIATKFKEELIAKNRELLAENQALKEKTNKQERKNATLEREVRELKKYTEILGTDIRLMRANTTNEDAMAKLLHDLNDLLKESKQTSSQVILYINNRI
eukprot:TRINITY_DN3156_c0_g1_i4.p1 TRINITY_DN3156_c0_g1~~TRINITY_DN3156_c0_g1_i4.p1  ORF type:complete len:176 (+),score=53.22 TRINITY_DN3156_c0_g1_i4:74-601(+)